MGTGRGALVLVWPGSVGRAGAHSVSATPPTQVLRRYSLTELVRDALKKWFQLKITQGDFLYLNKLFLFLVSSRKSRASSTLICMNK